MCYLHYNQCDNCRLPSTQHMRLASECADFVANVESGLLPTRSELIQLLRSTNSPKGMQPEVELIGQHTVARCINGLWDLQPTRACIRWTPLPEKWLCDSCWHLLQVDGRAQRGAEAERLGLAPGGSDVRDKKRVRPSPLTLEPPESQWKISGDDSYIEPPQPEGMSAMLAAGMGAPFPGEVLEETETPRTVLWEGEGKR